MKPTDDELKTDYREATRRDAWPAPDCPSAEALERLALGESPAEERIMLADHVGTCSGCAAQVQELRSLEGWAQRAVHKPQSHPPVRSSSRWPRWPVGLAASLLLAVTVALIWLPTSRQVSNTDPLRGIDQSVTPTSGTKLARPPDHLAWPAQLGATAYQVEIFDNEAELLVTSPWLNDSTFPVARPVAESWPAGIYTWVVNIQGNAPRSQLGPFRFQVTEGGEP